MMASERSSVFPTIPGFNSISSILIGCAFSFFVLFIHSDNLLESPSIITMFIIIFGALFCVSFIRISSLCTAAIQTPLIVVFCMTTYAILGLHAPFRQKILTVAMQLAQYFPLIFTAFTLSVLYACFRWYFQYKRQYRESLGQKVIKTSQNIQNLSAQKRYPPVIKNSRTNNLKKPSSKGLATHSTTEVPAPHRVNRHSKANSTRTVVPGPTIKKAHPTEPIRTKSVPQATIRTSDRVRPVPPRSRKTIMTNNSAGDHHNYPINNKTRIDSYKANTVKQQKATSRESNTNSAYLPVNPAEPRYPKRR